MKLCKNCVHFREGQLKHSCLSYGLKQEPIFGNLIPVKYADPEIERKDETLCGPEARYYEVK